MFVRKVSARKRAGDRAAIDCQMVPNRRGGDSKDQMRDTLGRPGHAARSCWGRRRPRWSPLTGPRGRKKRELVCAVMERADLKEVMEPDLTTSLRLVQELRLL